MHDGSNLERQRGPRAAQLALRTARCTPLLDTVSPPPTPCFSKETPYQEANPLSDILMACGRPADGQSGGGRYRWALINGFTSNVSAHQEVHATTGKTICGDASMNKRYCLGMSWSSIGLRMISTTDHLP